MHPEVAAKLDQLREACRVRGVRSLHLFGSAALGGFDPGRSDLDFLVQFQPLPEGRRADAYFALLDDLERMFGRPVDLVMRSAVRNPFFRASIENTQVPLYAAA
ncbi:MAG: nucleotidyltransferase family protein [Phycisphaerales bacterium]